MKSSSKPVLEAMKFEALKGVLTDGYYTKDLFGIVGMPGIWRRKPQSGKTQGVKVSFDGVKIELIRDKAIEHELLCAGLNVVTAEEQEAYIESEGGSLPGVQEKPENPDQLRIPGTTEEGEGEAGKLVNPEVAAGSESPQVDDGKEVVLPSNGKPKAAAAAK